MNEKHCLLSTISRVILCSSLVAVFVVTGQASHQLLLFGEVHFRDVVREIGSSISPQGRGFFTMMKDDVFSANLLKCEPKIAVVIHVESVGNIAFFEDIAGANELLLWARYCRSYRSELRLLTRQF